MKQIAAGLVLLLLSGQARAADYSPDIQSHIRAIENGLLKSITVEGDAHPTHSLAERMAALHVPAVSIAVMRNGRLEWAKAYGEARPGVPANTQTLFQAGSISKPLAAMAALRLVEQGKLALDADINTSLKSWKLPPSDAANGKPVTLRELLSHTGGLTIFGFPGYAADQAVPSVVQILDGTPPANTKPVRSEAEPGTRYKYSGGGYVIAQLAMTDVTGSEFPALLHNTVLAPIGMSHSTYEQPLPANLRANAVAPFDYVGRPIEGGAHTFPEMAAGGLWTTPSDLVRFAIEVRQSLGGKANHVLSKAMTEQMLTPGLDHWGLGFKIAGQPENPTFGHNGANPGFRNTFVVYTKSGDGVFVMTNGDGGDGLADEITRAAAAEYHWPDFKPVVRRAVPVDAAILASYIGTYAVTPTFNFEVRLEKGQLVSQGTDQASLVLRAASETQFFLEDIPADIEFFKASNGQPAYLMLHQNGRDIKAVRK